MIDNNVLALINESIERNLDTYIEWLARLCGQPSVAAQDFGMQECAEIVATLLADLGLKVEIMPTGGYPVVYGEGGKGKKTLLFYLHYDVQPPDPLDLWHYPPFELTRRDNKLYARGASDDKGHIVSRLAALMAVLEAMGELPCKVKFVIEGEEEIGSPSLAPFINKHKKKLAADACIWETGRVSLEGIPRNYLGLRGHCYVELFAQTATLDAHSGLGGSIFPNAAWRLTWALNTLKDQDENILIPGFYDNVVPASERDWEMLNTLPDTSDSVRQIYGLNGFLKGMTGGVELRHAEVFEPTCTICGLTSGYQGPSSKTVLPAEARAKVDFRLVPDQTPEEVLEKLRAHLDAQGFEDIDIIPMGGGRPARTDPDHPFIHLCNEAAREVYGVEPEIYPMIGGSGPNYPFVHVLGLPVTMAGVGYPGSQIHAPNEHIRLDDFVKGIKHVAHIVVAFGHA